MLASEDGDAGNSTPAIPWPVRVLAFCRLREFSASASISVHQRFHSLRPSRHCAVAREPRIRTRKVEPPMITDSHRSLRLCSESRQGFRPPADKQRSASFSLCRIDLGSLRYLLPPPGILRISVHQRFPSFPSVAPLRRRARTSDRFASDPSSRPSVPRPERQGTDSRRHGATFRSAGLTPPRPG